jgi:NADH-quinone oxidoreductase subunit A
MEFRYPDTEIPWATSPITCTFPLYTQALKNGINHKIIFNAGRSMNNLLSDYAPILVFFGVALGLSLFIILLAWLRSTSLPDAEKLSPYECGFDAFSDARMKFDVRYYLIAILFIIFDLEIAFLFPWAMSLKAIGWFGFASMMVFLSVLTIGFIYEWKKGALEWE